MKKRTINLALIALSLMTLVASCKKNNDELEQLEKKKIFSLVDSKTIMLNGVINTNSLKEFNDLYAKNKTVKTINIKDCDGSINDEVNLQLSKRVHELKLNTHLMDNGAIASGGVDFFLAGIKRTAGKDTKIGVHSWSDGSKSATDYPKGHANHQPYIDYYKSIGFTQKEAEEFYYFTINAASASSIHWMTAEEIAKYNILTTDAVAYTIKQIMGVWQAENLSTKDQSVEVTIYENSIYFGDFKKVQGQWSLLAPEGMNTFNEISIRNNVVYGKLALSNGAIERYRELNLNKAVIDLAEDWTKNEREIFKILSIDDNKLIINYLSRSGKERMNRFLIKK